MLTRKGIDAEFTKLVQSYLAEGYQICTGTNQGSQTGLRGRVDMAKGNNLVRISLSSFDEEMFVWRGLEITVTELTKPRKFWSCGFFGLDDTCFTEVESRRQRFYELHPGPESAWGTKEEAQKARETRWARSENWPRSSIWKPRPNNMEQAKKALLPLIHKIPGLKSAKLKDLDDVCKEIKTNSSGQIVVEWICYIRGRIFRYNPNDTVFYGTWFHKKDGVWKKS